MRKIKKVLSILHDGLNSVDPRKLTTESIYYVDEESGETVKIAEYFGEDSLKLLSRIKRGINDECAYSTLFQKSLEDLMVKLKPNELRILLYFVSKMGYENVVFGVTYRGVAKALGMSVRTVTTSVNSLIGYNLLKKFGSKQKKVYYVNPSVAWKGSKNNIGRKTGMFISAENPTGLGK
jgi:DNA-binding MarR family transcriptional regulator